MQARRVLDRIWQGLGEDRWLWAMLAGLLVAQLPGLFLPQAPVAPAQPAQFTRWLAEQRPTLGAWADALARGGWLSFRVSVWMRAIIAGVAVITAARGAWLLEHWGESSLRRRWLYGLICLGGGLIVLGWGAQMLWGWAETGIVAWPGQPVELPEHQVVIPARQAGMRWAGGYGLYLLPQGRSVGLELTVADVQGQPVGLQSSARGEPQARLNIALLPRAPETFFALPTEELIVRLSLRAEAPTEILVQAYRSASGELLIEDTLTADVLPLNGVRMYVTRYDLPSFKAVYNPGAPLTAAGGLLISSGAIALTYRRRRRTVEAPNLAVSPEVSDSASSESHAESCAA